MVIDSFQKFSSSHERQNSSLLIDRKSISRERKYTDEEMISAERQSSLKRPMSRAKPENCDYVVPGKMDTSIVDEGKHSTTYNFSN